MKTTPQQMLAFVELVEDARRLRDLYNRTVDSRLRYEVPKLEKQVDEGVAALKPLLLADADETERVDGLAAEQVLAGVPDCPKCGAPMTCGAPHGPWPVQYECRVCGTVVVPPSSMTAIADQFAIVAELAEVSFAAPLNSAEVASLILRAKQLVRPSATAAVERERLALEVAATAADPSAYGPRVAVAPEHARAREEGGVR